ncbi:MAG: DUF6134 family protein [Bernardetiaceae bacterium]
MLFLLLSSLTFWLFVDSSPAALEETLVYDVFSGQKVIGEIRATRITTRDTVHYDMKTSVSYQVLFKTMQFDNHILSQYRAGSLQKASSTDHLNQKLRSQNQITRQGKHYRITEDSKSPRILPQEVIQHCLLSIYFEEPRGVNQVFSQRLADLIPIEPAGDHRYAVHLSSSKTNFYQFKDGICHEVEVDHWFDRFTFRLRSHQRSSR